jgi:hypothetical protein
MFIAANIVCCSLRHQDAQVPTVSSINSLLSQYCKASHYFFGNFYVGGGVPTVRFAPVVPWANTGPGATSSSTWNFKGISNNNL